MQDCPLEETGEQGAPWGREIRQSSHQIRLSVRHRYPFCPNDTTPQRKTLLIRARGIPPGACRSELAYELTGVAFSDRTRRATFLRKSHLPGHEPSRRASPLED